MAHFKCAACHGRVSRYGDGAHACPSCGGPLELVRRAEELIGLRALPVRQDNADEPGAVADHVRAAIARHDAARDMRLGAAGLGRPPDGAV